MRGDRAGARRAYSAGDPLPQASPATASLAMDCTSARSRHQNAVKAEWIATGRSEPMMEVAIRQADRTLSAKNRFIATATLM